MKARRIRRSGSLGISGARTVIDRRDQGNIVTLAGTRYLLVEKTPGPGFDTFPIDGLSEID